jgi:hypothetical protein
VTSEAINKLRKMNAEHFDASPVEVFKLHIDSIAAEASRKYDAQEFNHQNEIVVGVGDL